MKTILKVLVGSRAHGLNDPDSDFDYRGVFVVPTADILKTFHKEKSNSWIEGEVDDTAYEIGHFLELAQKSNPSVLEVLFAPVVESTPLGDELRALAPKLWNTKDLLNAFVGYSHNQRKKMEDDKDSRRWKFAVAYCRVLIQGAELIQTGTMQYPLRKNHAELRAIRKGLWSMGQVLDWAENLKTYLYTVADTHPHQFTDKEAVDNFLLSVRKANFE